MRKSIKAVSDTIRIATSSTLPRAWPREAYICVEMFTCIWYMLYIVSLTPDSVNGGGDWICTSCIVSKKLRLPELD